MEAMLFGLDEVVCTRHGLLWTLTSTALKRLRSPTSTHLPGPLSRLHCHRGLSRPLYQSGCEEACVQLDFSFSPK
uniref:Uncharacterized protein n=1 Tax=Knipowitschia caucasica TaxID=637954 RepID=A0AAV2KQ65_KNICA